MHRSFTHASLPDGAAYDVYAGIMFSLAHN
jgi:hypothetical protein